MWYFMKSSSCPWQMSMLIVDLLRCWQIGHGTLPHTPGYNMLQPNVKLDLQLMEGAWSWDVMSELSHSRTSRMGDCSDWERYINIGTIKVRTTRTHPVSHCYSWPRSCRHVVMLKVPIYKQLHLKFKNQFRIFAIALRRFFQEAEGAGRHHLRILSM